MDDYISRQAAIDAIVNTVSEIGLHDNSEVARYGATFRQHEIIDIIEGVPSAQPEPKWIPWNSGKLPEESGTYTVTAYDGATKRVTYAKYQKRLKRWELTGARAYWRVLAWMPLPEPYAERRTDG